MSIEGRNSWHLLFSVALVFIIMVCSRACVAYTPVLYGKLVDSLQTPSTNVVAGCACIILAYVTARLTGEILFHWQEYISVKFSQHLSYIVTEKTFAHLMTLSHDFYINSMSGGTLQVMLIGARAVSGFLFSILFSATPIIFECIFIFIGVSLYVSHIYMLVLFGLVVSYIIISSKLISIRFALMRNVNKMDNLSDAVVVESLNNFESIKLLNCKNYFQNKFCSILKKKRDSIFKSSYRLALIETSQSIILMSSFVIFVFHMLYQLQNGELSVGGVVTVISFINQLFLPLQMLSLEQEQLQQCRVDIEGLFSVLEKKATVDEKENAPNLKIINGLIEYKDVTFGYQKNKNILQKLSFIVNPNTMLSIVGKVGIGKTSIIRTLLRFYDISSGAIFIDGQNIKDVTLSSLRASISVVPQNVTLFNASIADNICCFQKIPKETIIKVTKLTGLHDDIMRMPEAYSTIVGEKGEKLSGGEKQKIAFTRAILTNTKIIVLDEPLTGLDATSRKEILQIISNLKKNHTIIAISHENLIPKMSDAIITLKY